MKRLSSVILSLAVLADVVLKCRAVQLRVRGDVRESF